MTDEYSSRQATQWHAVQALSRMLETDGVCKSAMIGVLAIHLVQRERLLSQVLHAPPSRSLRALQCIEAAEDAEVSLRSARSQPSSDCDCRTKRSGQDETTCQPSPLCEDLTLSTRLGKLLGVQSLM